MPESKYALNSLTDSLTDSLAYAFRIGRIGRNCSCRTLPRGFDEQARTFALQGCYVLALACRELSNVEAAKVNQIDRDAVEKDLSFVGLINFRNELKVDTTEAICTLKAGDVRPVMITGDNAQCGFYISRKCGMIAAEARVLLCEASPPPNNEAVMWRYMDAEVKHSAGGSALTTQQAMATPPEVELAVTGAAFDLLVSNGDMDRLLLRTRFFARMSPDGKVKAVQMHMAKGLIVGMCGDGGNDCGALRAAHAGMALSEAEASVVSPFTSKTKSISSVVDLLKEGRGSLATSFAGYKFLITCGWHLGRGYWVPYGIRPATRHTPHAVHDALSFRPLSFEIMQCRFQLSAPSLLHV